MYTKIIKDAVVFDSRRWLSDLNFEKQFLGEVTQTGSVLGTIFSGGWMVHSVAHYNV